MRHPRISILSAPLAQRVADAYFSDASVKLGMPAQHSIGGIAHEDTPYWVQVLVRSTYRGRSRANFNGTVHVQVNRTLRPVFKHAGGYRPAVKTSSGYVREATYDTLYRDIARRVEKLYALLPPDLLTLREEVWELAARKGPLSKDLKVEGRTSRYSEMTEDDCHYWMGTLNQLPERT